MLPCGGTGFRDGVAFVDPRKLATPASLAEHIAAEIAVRCQRNALAQTTALRKRLRDLRAG
ncbi:hypothetical protein [Saccharopolyspora pogona]|uniref:hypothetical protein n=1 Tax=Saccharopolyspora pogona TaxID=333966 RepID=UPI001684FF4D|nr:hypothetical protein [Saccharopolyspora pogona]